MKPVLMVIAPKDFRDEELFETQAEIEREGITTVIASTHTGTCTGSKGGTAIATASLDQVDTDNYEALVFVGGFGSKVFFEDKVAQKIAVDMYQEGKLIGAICIAPVILAKAGLLHKKAATVYESEIKTITDLEAVYSGESVTQDGQLITGNGPGASSLFGKTIAAQVKKRSGLMAD